MTPVAHRIYRTTLILIVVVVTIYLAYSGFSYYTTPLEERFYHPQHDWFKPSGLFGHGLGIIGTLLILIGVVMYMVRKRSRMMARWGRLKYWLEFHIFLCVLGPVMVLFHTAFKFGGIVSVAFWSMVAVVASGVVGRFIYVRIPRSIGGRALSLDEVKEMRMDIEKMLKSSYNFDDEQCKRLLSYSYGQGVKQGGFLGFSPGAYLEKKKHLRAVKRDLKATNMPADYVKTVVGLVKKEMDLNSQIENLELMHKLFRYWHVVHLPFALIMLIIVIIHVIVTVTFGAHWIFG